MMAQKGEETWRKVSKLKDKEEKLHMERRK
jgi:hypothetical protein